MATTSRKVTAWMLGLFLMACGAAAAPLGGDSTLVPGDSVADSDIKLYRDVMRRFAEFVTTNYNCAPWKVLDTKRVQALGIFQLDDEGRVKRGSVEERWTTDICGDQVMLRVTIAPQNEWGTVVDFQRL